MGARDARQSRIFNSLKKSLLTLNVPVSCCECHSILFVCLGVFLFAFRDGKRPAAEEKISYGVSLNEGSVDSEICLLGKREEDSLLPRLECLLGVT